MASGTENKFLLAALKLQKMGFRVFPIAPGRKLPVFKGYTPVASSDPEKARMFWKCALLGIDLHYNIAIATTQLQDGRKLVVVDVDNKNGKCGDDEIFKLELDGKYLPDTFTQFTPTGGRHLVYWTTVIVGNSVGYLAPGLDTRGRGGFIVGAGSEVAAGTYTANSAPIVEAPEWLTKALAHRPRKALPHVGASIDQSYAESRAVAFLASQQGAVSGSQSARAYELACRLKDLGVSAFGALELMSEHWAARCSPPLTDDDLSVRVDNAYRYGKEKPGAGAPENAFEEIKDEPPAVVPPPKEEKAVNPIQKLNKDHAFIMTGAGHLILWETIDSAKRQTVRYVAEPSFHRQYANKTMVNGAGKMEPITKVWMRSDERRSYDGLCFRPGLTTPPGWYNLWRGFAVEPAKAITEGTPEAIDSLDMFLQHARQNICDGDAPLFDWLIGYFAHMVQCPSEKPMVALVFRGKKGVGKNALVERMGYLMGGHYTLASDSRYLLGNFNSHLENCCFFVLDEAFWSGDKKAEGRLKDLITGSHHNIERKGQEPYKVENCTRVAIIGNEDWIVPATQDERRFAVFNVKNSRKGDGTFFRKMIHGMENGGYRLLLRYLLDYDFSEVDVNTAPVTVGLMEQKIESFNMIEQWWHECLIESEIVEGQSDGWPETITRPAFRDAFSRYSRNRNNRSRIPDDRSFGRLLTTLCPTIGIRKFGNSNGYRIPSVTIARKEFEHYLGHDLKWD